MADAPVTNDIKGKVAVVIRGGASFVEKARAVQAGGAIGMIVANSEDVLGRLVGDASDITIPCALSCSVLLQNCMVGAVRSLTVAPASCNAVACASSRLNSRVLAQTAAFR